jgi:hypothetical protein
VSAGQASLDDYKRGLSAAARTAGEERSRSADPDAFDEARTIVLELIAEGPITADDVRPRMQRGTAMVLGAVFGALRREGLIEPDGVTTSTVPSRHGAIQRRWRAAS